MKEKDKLYREAIEAKSEAVLIYVGKKIAEKKAAEYERIVKEESDIKMPQEVRERITRMVMEEKKKAKSATPIHWVKKISIVACLTIFASFCVGTALITTVDAFRYKFENFLTEINQKDIKLTPDAGGEERPAGIPASWQGIWYPEYLPEGFYFDLATEREGIKTIIFINKKNNTIKFSQSPANGTQIYLDNEGNAKGVLKVKEQYDGYWIVSDGQMVLTWLQKDLIMELIGDLKIDEIKAIANNLKYFK